MPSRRVYAEVWQAYGGISRGADSPHGGRQDASARACVCSQAKPELPLHQIDALAQDAATHNLIAGVTGVLLTDGRRFLQYIEGPEEGVALAYSRIVNSTSHTDISVLGRSAGRPRRFPYWSIRWLPVEPEDLRIARVSDWRGLAVTEETAMFQVPTGIDRVTQLVNPFIGLDPPGGRPAGSALF